MHPAEDDDHVDLQVGTEMPRYVSHKKVWALEIDSADPVTCKLSFRDKGYAAIKTDAEMWSRYKPVPGDFYVQYDDGYKSFSPRKAFLEGYRAEKV
jgi:hypothetical protein